MEKLSSFRRTIRAILAAFLFSSNAYAYLWEMGVKVTTDGQTLAVNKTFYLYWSGDLTAPYRQCGTAHVCSGGVNVACDIFNPTGGEPNSKGDVTMPWIEVDEGVFYIRVDNYYVQLAIGPSGGSGDFVVVYNGSTHAFYMESNSRGSTTFLSGGTLTWTDATASVTIDQTLSDMSARIGNVERWFTSKTRFFTMAPLGAAFDFSQATTHVMRADQSIIEDEKFAKWDAQLSVLNHRQFVVGTSATQIVSRFHETSDDVKIGASLIDASTFSVPIEFKDPWYRDSLDASKQYARMNRGTDNAVWRARTVGESDFLPNYATPYPEGVYQGVLTDQLVSSGNYYSVRAPLGPVTAGSLSAYFLKWNATGADVEASNPQSSIVFHQSNSVIRAIYKTARGSSISSASGATSQRKLITDASGYYHMVYESAGDIWYTKSTNSGSTWSAEILLSGGRGLAHNPALADNWAGAYTRSYCVWTESTVRTGKTGYDLMSRLLDLSTGQWSSTQAIVPDIGQQTDPIAKSDSKPAAAMISSGDNTSRPTAVVIYEGSGNQLKSVLRSYDRDYGQYLWYQWTVSTSSSAARPSVIYDASSRVYVTYDDGSNVYHVTSDPVTSSIYLLCGTPVQISTTSRYTGNTRSVITQDYLGNRYVAWKALDSYCDYEVAIAKCFYNGSWGSMSAFLSDLTESPSVTSSNAGFDLYAGANMYFSDGTTLFNERTTDGSSWSNLSLSSYGTTIAHPNIVPIVDPSAVGSIFTKNTSSPYELRFEQRDNSSGMGKTSHTTDAIAVTASRESFRSIRFIDPETGGYLQLRVKNPTVTAPTGGINSTLPFTSDSMNADISSDQFSVNDGSTISMTLLIDAKNWNHGGSVRAILVDAKTGMLIQSIGQRNVDQALQSGGSLTLQAPAPSNKMLRFVLACEDLDRTKIKTESANEYVYHKVAGVENPDPSVTGSDIPTEDGIEANYPNPFNPATQIHYQLASPAHVTMKIYDIVGREVMTLVEGNRGIGYHSVTFNGSQLPSGAYFCRSTIRSENGEVKSWTRKMLLAK